MSRLQKTAGAWIDAIRIKQVRREPHQGQACIVRTRGAGAAPIIKVANLFFRLAHNPVRVCPTSGEWLQWELHCFKLLHGDQAVAFAQPPATVVTEIFPGHSLAWHFEQGSFQEEMLESAALEMRRAHQTLCPILKAQWSHGDANLANFLFDPATGRARIIDFEIVPDGTLGEAERHAEDLLVFLQDLAGCIDRERWLPAAQRFLKSYRQPGVIEQLKPRLAVPGGIPGLWWWIRSNYIGLAELRERFELLRKALG